MLKRFLIALTLTCAALFLIDRASLFVAPCSSYSNHQNNNDATKKNDCAAREGVIIAGIELLGDIKPEVWTALATIAIAAFTMTLWLSSEKMWGVTKISAEAAQKSADALPAIERAYLFLDDEIETNFVNVTREKNGDRMEAVVKFSFRNHGKTPAILKGIKGTAGHSSSYPEVGRKSLALIEGEFPDGVVVTSGRKSRPFECECFMDKANFEEARGGFGYIVFFGEVRFSDVLEDTWRVGFCREYDFGSGQFVYLPTYKNLNYYEKEERKGG